MGPINKSIIWLFLLGIILLLFNILSWLIVSYYALSIGFGNSAGRALLGIGCLLVSSLTTYYGLHSAYSLQLYIKEYNNEDMNKAFELELKFWNCWYYMAAAGTGILLLMVSSAI